MDASEQTDHRTGRAIARAEREALKVATFVAWQAIRHPARYGIKSDADLQRLVARSALKTASAYLPGPVKAKYRFRGGRGRAFEPGLAGGIANRVLARALRDATAADKENRMPERPQHLPGGLKAKRYPATTSRAPNVTVEGKGKKKEEKHSPKKVPTSNPKRTTSPGPSASKSKPTRKDEE